MSLEVRKAYQPGARHGSLLTNQQRHELDGVALDIADAFDVLTETLYPIEDRRKVYLCTCSREGPDGHFGCNTLVESPGWCANCFNDRSCRPDLATPRSVEWACSQLERLIAWARGFNYERRRERVQFAEEVGLRRWNEEGASWFEVTGTYPEKVANHYRALTEPFVVGARDGSWIVP